MEKLACEGRIVLSNVLIQSRFIDNFLSSKDLLANIFPSEIEIK